MVSVHPYVRSFRKILTEKLYRVNKAAVELEEAKSTVIETLLRGFPVCTVIKTDRCSGWVLSREVAVIVGEGPKDSIAVVLLYDLYKTITFKKCKESGKYQGPKNTSLSLAKEANVT